MRWLERKQIGYAPPLFVRYAVGVAALALASGERNFSEHLLALAAPVGLGVALGHWLDHLHDGQAT